MAEVEDEEEVKGGELLFCGATNWNSVGRRYCLKGNLVSPTLLRPLLGVNICFVASGSVSCHCVALDVEGRCYTWGRNAKGQLGHGDRIQRDRPAVVSGMSGHKVINAGAGRNHTVLITEAGDSFSFGWNKHGQLGTGSVKKELEVSPVRCLVSGVVKIACGADFTVWLTNTEGSSILTAGLPQYGQLGHGIDNEYNSKAGSVKLIYEAQPRPKAIASLARETIVKVACGANHTVAVDKSGYVYTWGFGGYGRLGHREQKDEWNPRRVDVFTRKNVLPPEAIVSAGSCNSACTAEGGQLYMWGKLKITGDESMYPKPLMDLSGWHLRCMDSGYMHHFVGADSSCISWGQAQSGELGYGPNGQKTSAVPKKVDILESMHVIGVACGYAHSMVIVDRTNVGDRLDELDVYDCKAAEEVIVGEDPQINNTPQKNAKKGSEESKKRKNAKASSESEDEEENSDFDSDDSEGQLNGQAVGKSNGKGRGKNTGKLTADKKGNDCGRGRPPSAKKSSQSTTVSNRKRGRPQKS